MAQEDEITSYISREGWQSDTDFALAELNKVFAAIQQSKGVKLELGKATNFSQLNQGLKEYQGIQSQVIASNEKLEQATVRTAGVMGTAIEAQIKPLIKYEERLKSVRDKINQLSQFKGLDEGGTIAKEIEKLRIEEAQLNEVVKKATAELRNNVKEQYTYNNSIEEARARLKLLRTERDQQDLKTDEGRTRKQELNDQINQLDEFIAKETDIYTKRKINIGAYAESLEGSFQGSAKIIVDALERARAKSEQLNTELGESHPAAQAARREFEGLDRITQNPQFLNIASKTGDAIAETRHFTKVLIELEQQGQKNTQVYRDTQARLAQLTDEIADTRAEVKALSSDTRGFDLFASAINTVVSTTQTAVGVTALLGNENEDLQKSIQKLVALENVANGVRAIANDLTNQATLAYKAAAFFQNNYRIATDASAAATTRFNAALKLIGVGLIIGAITALIANFDKLRNALSGISRQQQAVNDALKEAKPAYVEAVKNVEDLRIQIDLAKQGLVNKKLVVDQYNETIGQTTGAVKTLDEAEKELAKNADAYIRFTLLKAAANAVLAKAAEGLVEAEIENARTLQNFEQNRGTLFDAGDEGEKRVFERRKKRLEERNTLLLNIARDFQTEMATIAKEFNFTGQEVKPVTDKKTDAKSDNEIKIEDEKTKALLDIMKLRRQQRIELNNLIIEDEKAALTTRLVALSDNILAERQIIQDQAAFDISVLNKKTGEEIAKANEAFSKKEITQRQHAKILSDIRANASANEQLIEATKYDAILKLALETNKQIELITKSSNEEEFRTTKVIQAGYMDALKNFITEQDKNRQEDIKKDEEYTKRKKELYEQLYEELAATAFAFIAAGYEKEKNAIQDQIDKLEEKKQKDIEVANQTIANTEQRAAAIAVIESRADAERQRLERRQRQVDQEKARFEKAKDIANIIQTTAVAIIETLAAYPGPPGVALAAVIGAIGAAQLARVLATPIPRYEKGGKNVQPGLAIAGEKGAELVVEKSGNAYLTPGKASFLNLKGGEDIFDADFTRNLLLNIAHNGIMDKVSQYDGKGSEASINKKLISKYDEQISLLKKIEKKPIFQIDVHNDAAFQAYVNFHTKQ